jgi:hypothetical protein
MYFLNFILTFALLISVNVWSMEDERPVGIHKDCQDMLDVAAFIELFEKQKELAPTNPPWMTCSVMLSDAKNLNEFSTLDKGFLPHINKISIFAQDASKDELVNFGNFFSTHAAHFSKLSVFISSNVKLGDSLAQALSHINSLTQINIGDADLTNEAVGYFLKCKKLRQLNLSKNKNITNDCSSHFDNYENKSLTLIIHRTSITQTIADKLESKIGKLHFTCL